MGRKSIVSNIEGEIRKLGDCLSQAGLLIDINNTCKHTLGGNIVRLAWDDYGVIKDIDFASIQEYLILIENRQFTFVLFDGSLIQIVYHFRNRNIVKHSLGFYSSPVPILSDELMDYIEHGLTLQDLLEDKINTNEFTSDLRLRSPIRFDYDIDNNSFDHPASHLHLSQSNCRIPVFAPISIGHFMHFIFRHFYPEHWYQYEFIRNWRCDTFRETIIPQHNEQLHLRCSR